MTKFKQALNRTVEVAYEVAVLSLMAFTYGCWAALPPHDLVLISEDWEEA